MGLAQFYSVRRLLFMCTNLENITVVRYSDRCTAQLKEGLNSVCVGRWCSRVLEVDDFPQGSRNARDDAKVVTKCDRIVGAKLCLVFRSLL
jgi:hypothetical protein